MCRCGFFLYRPKSSPSRSGRTQRTWDNRNYCMKRDEVVVIPCAMFCCTCIAKRDRRLDITVCYFLQATEYLAHTIPLCSSPDLLKSELHRSRIVCESMASPSLIQNQGWLADKLVSRRAGPTALQLCPLPFSIVTCLINRPRTNRSDSKPQKAHLFSFISPHL